MAHHDDDDNDGDEDLLKQRVAERAQCLVDQTRAVVERYDLDLADCSVGQCFLWKARGDLIDLRLDILNRGQGIQNIKAMAIPDNATMLASTLKNFILMKVISTASGSIADMSALLRR